MKFLDCYEVLQSERDEVSKEALFHEVVSYKEDDIKNNNTNDNDYSRGIYTPLAKELDVDKDESVPKGASN